MVTHTEPGNFNGFTDWLIWANTISKGWFTLMALLSIFFIAFLQMKRVTNNRVALTSSGFFTSMLAMLLWILNVLTLNHFIIVLAVFALIMATAKWVDKGY